MTSDPQSHDLSRLRASFHSTVANGLREDDRTAGRHRHDCNARFAMQRFDEGVEIGAYLEREYGARRLCIVDIGAGNGGVSLALAGATDHLVVALDLVPNPALRESFRAAGVPLRLVIGSATALPFRSGALDVVLCLEVLEHLPQVDECAREMMRAVMPGGQVMITTPPRARYLLGRDPHFAIRGLLLLPDLLQRFVAERVFRLGNYDVVHIFWFARSVIRLFPQRGRTETLVNVPWPPPPRRLADMPQLIWHHVTKRLRHVLWNRIVVYRAGKNAGVTSTRAADHS